MNWFAVAVDGAIFVIDQVPTDALVIAVGQRAILLDALRQMADRDAAGSMVVPGVAEATNKTEALRAVIRFSGRLQRAVDAEGEQQ